MLNLTAFKGDLDTGAEALEEHSKDKSVFKVYPCAVVYPKDVADVVTIVNEVRKDHATDKTVSLSVRAGGTCMSGGSLNNGYMMNLTRYMNHVEVDPIAMTATVELGAYFRDIEDEAAKHGLMFAPYPSSHRVCGIGGMIGNNASGEKSMRYGSVIDNVISLEVVLADGTVLTTGARKSDDLPDDHYIKLKKLYDEYGEMLSLITTHVPKVASGYRLDRIIKEGNIDLTPLFIGAQGTLGIVTKAVLKLVPIPKFSRLVFISAPSERDLSRLLLVAKDFNPESVETFDIHTLESAEFSMKIPYTRVMREVRGGDSIFILVQFSEDTQELTDGVAQKYIDAIVHSDAAIVYVEDETLYSSLWNIRRASYTVIQTLNVDGYKAVPCIEDVIVPLGSIGLFIEELTAMLTSRQYRYAFHGHIGDGSLRIIPFFDFKDENVADNIIAFMREVFVLVKKYKGNISADHSDGIIRSPFLKEFYGENICSAFDGVNAVLDPEGILNPHKKVNCDEGLINQWIDRS